MDIVKNAFVFLFLAGLFIYGAYIFLGAMRNWKSFSRLHKSIDLIQIFGDFGRVLYVVFGLAVCAAAVLLFLKKIGIEPLAGMK